jgi:hypothetical protein
LGFAGDSLLLHIHNEISEKLDWVNAHSPRKGDKFDNIQNSVTAFNFIEDSRMKTEPSTDFPLG